MGVTNYLLTGMILQVKGYPKQIRRAGIESCKDWEESTKLNWFRISSIDSKGKGIIIQFI